MVWKIGHYRENPLEVVRSLGQSLAGDIGVKALEELELAYACRLLPNFSQNIIRVNQNLLLY